MIPSKAAQSLLSLLRETGQYVPPVRERNGKGLAHAIWLLEGIHKEYIEEEKAHRWLGYAQAILVTEDIADLSSMKHVNMVAEELGPCKERK